MKSRQIVPVTRTIIYITEEYVNLVYFYVKHIAQVAQLVGLHL